MSELKEGTELSAVYIGPKDDEVAILSKGGVTRIVVSMQAGHMAPVPWIRIERNGCPPLLLNAAYVEGVEIKERDR